MAESEYRRTLENYHCDLATLADAFEHVVWEIPDSAGPIGAVGTVCVRRFQQLVEQFPFLKHAGGWGRQRPIKTRRLCSRSVSRVAYRAGLRKPSPRPIDHSGFTGVIFLCRKAPVL